MRRASLSQTLAATPRVSDAFEMSAKAEEFRRFRQDRSEALASLATLAGGKEWIAGVKRLLRQPCPSFMAQRDWDALCWRTLQFGRKWADEGLGCGWTMLDMFGCNPDPAARRVDRNGVAMTICRMLSPINVAAVDAKAWHLADRSGSLMRFTRMDRLGQVPMWTAFGPRAGP